MNKTNHIILAIVLCFSLVFVAFPLKGFSYYLGNGNGAVDVGEPGGTEGPFEGDGYEYYTGYVPPPPPIDGVTAPGGWIVTEVSPIEEESTTARIKQDDDDNGSSPPPSSGGGCTEDPPPVTSPPATSPPVTSPPATSPPVTSPPVTSPPATSPPPTSPPPTSPPPTLPAIEPCMIHYFEVPSRAWVDYPITGKWSASASCDDCDVDCTPYSECAWKQDSIGTGFDEYKFTLSQSGTYDYTLTCYGEGGIDERTESATVEALNLPWWQEIIPVLQGFLRGVWG